jgi:hypothetical protein
MQDVVTHLHLPRPEISPASWRIVLGVCLFFIFINAVFMIVTSPLKDRSATTASPTPAVSVNRNMVSPSAVTRSQAAPTTDTQPAQIIRPARLDGETQKRLLKIVEGEAP